MRTSRSTVCFTDSKEIVMDTPQMTGLMSLMVAQEVSDLCDECLGTWGNLVPIREFRRLLDKYGLEDWSVIPAAGLEKLQRIVVY